MKWLALHFPDLPLEIHTRAAVPASGPLAVTVRGRERRVLRCNPAAAALGAEDAFLHLIVAAVFSGAVFGDHCSPISDTTILSSLASSCNHIEHVRTQLPYALLGGILTTILYLILGFSMI